MPKQSTPNQIYRKVRKKANGCWIYRGAVNTNGYPQVSINRSIWLAHRLSYTITFGPIPQGLKVCHKCDVRNCINPNHLFLGTQKDNIDDMLKKGRNGAQFLRKTHCIRGHELKEGSFYLSKRNSRNCKECHKLRAKEYARKKMDLV